MTVSSTINRHIYLGNGETREFPIVFKFFDITDLRVFITNQTQETRELRSGYQVMANAKNENGQHEGGCVIYPHPAGAPLSTGWRITILRRMEATQLTDLVNQGPYYAEIVEGTFDYSRMIDQQHKEELDRCIKFPEWRVPDDKEVNADEYLRVLQESVNTANEAAIAAREAADIAISSAGVFKIDGDGDATSITPINIVPNAGGQNSLGTAAKPWGTAHIDTVYGNLTGNITGNAASAAKLEAARTINGIPFDGTEDIEIKTGGLPVGTILAFPVQNPPPGFLECNGAAVGRETCPELFACIGTTYGAGDGSTTFNLPDLRGEFVRGFDGGRGVDAGRELGSFQGDAIRNIKGEGGISDVYGTTSGVFTLGSPVTVIGGGHSTGTAIKFDASRVVPTANENRPRNIALVYCVKAFDAPVNQGLLDVSKLAQDIAGASAGLNDLALKKLWVSGEYTPVIGTPTIVTHGLNVNPLKAKGEVLLKCILATQGYSVGDFARGFSFSSSYGGVQVYIAPTVALEETTISTVTGNGATGLYVINKNDGAYQGNGSTLANWRYIFRIWY